MTTKLIGVLCLAMMCGCTTSVTEYVTLYDCGDDMGCTIGQERFTQDVDESVAVSTVLVTIPNRNGSNMIALGSADEMGAILLKPRVSNFTSNVNLYVSAGAPFIGHIDGPIDVYKIYKMSVLGPTNPILDVISFEEIPPVAPKRAVMTKTATFTLDGSGNNSTQALWKVTGRKRVRVTMSSPANNTFTGSISAQGALVTGERVQLDLKSIAGVSASYADFSENALYLTGATLPPPGTRTIDYIAIGSFSSGTAGDTINVTLQAWDD